MASSVRLYRRPLVFYLLATALPWAFWGMAGHLSRIEPATPSLVLAASILGFLGLLGPMAVAAALCWPDRALRRDLLRRFTNFSETRPIHWLVACLVMPASILLATAISLLFGYGAAQFTVTGHYTFSSGVFPVWFLLFVAPIIEEVGWHSYGTDSLRSRFNVFATSMIFAAFWAIWHAPLASIKGYYQSNLAAAGLAASLNFALSIFPFVMIMNWLYYKAGRNIAIVAVFHITAGYFNEIFATHPDTKIIQTVVLTVLTLGLVLREPAFFFRREPFD